MFRSISGKVICAGAGMWSVSMLILYVDSFSIDWALLVTLMLAMFTFILKNAVDNARIEQKIDDLPCQNCPDPNKNWQRRRQRSA
jgi:low affinity Fe/Cu permease